MKRKRSATGLHAVLLLAIALLLVTIPCFCQTSRDLHTVHSIFIASVEAGSSADAIRHRIADRLEKAGSLRVASNPDTADAVLRVTGSIWSTGTVSPNLRSGSTHAINYQGYLSAELISADHRTLWSYMVTPSRFRASSIADDLADQLTSRLVAAIRSGIPYPSAVGAKPAAMHVTLRAAGSTLAAPLLEKWFEIYAQYQPGINILYESNGTGAGIEQLKAGEIDFAGSDIPLVNDTSSFARSILHIPTMVGGVVPIYNLPGLDGRTLNLTPQVLVGIYSGAIRKWNDPRLREWNHGAQLPDADIAVVYRSDGSGTTDVWTSYLSVVSPEWKSRYGSGLRVQWATGTGAPGNEGVAQLVGKTPNAIGYVELIYAVQHNLNYATVRNAAGRFIKADIDSIAAAAPEAAADHGNVSYFSILDAAGRTAYPISTFTWLLVPPQQSDPEKRTAILQFLRWMLTSGQRECEALGYAPLPHRVIAHELDTLNGQ